MDIGGATHTQSDDTQNVERATTPQRQPPNFGPTDLSMINATPQSRPRWTSSSEHRQSPVDHPTEFVKHIQVADLAGIARIKETLDSKSKNWNLWSQSMHLMLDIVDASRYVDGTVKQPSSARDPVGVENWHFNDTYTRVLIRRNIATSEKCHIRGCETAHDM